MTIGTENRIAITGGGGWLGRELVQDLLSSGEDLQTLALGTHNRTVAMGKTQIDVHKWDSTILADWQPTHLVHLACVTREHHVEDSTRAAEQNAEILKRLSGEMHRLSLRGVLLASSGAAVTSPMDAYGQHKMSEEVAVTAIAKSLGINSVIARVWSVTGEHCTKPQKFLFYDLLRQALAADTDEIVLSGPRRVCRRYVDGGEFLHACLRVLLSENSAEFNSGGELVSSTRLARRIQALVAPHKSILENFVDEKEEVYAAGSDESDALSIVSGIRMSPLNDQIVRSISALSGSEGMIA